MHIYKRTHEHRKNRYVKINRHVLEKKASLPRLAGCLRISLHCQPKGDAFQGRITLAHAGQRGNSRSDKKSANNCFKKTPAMIREVL